MRKTAKILLFSFISWAIFSAGFFVLASCNSHAYKDCLDDKIYWYDSCSDRQGLYRDCSDDGLACQYGRCVSYGEISNNNNEYGLGFLIPHAQKGCFNNSIYWYDSNGFINDLYQNCFDSNGCTIDSCLDAVCFNVLKCDGSACKSGSADYKKYCAIEEPQEPENYECGDGECDSAVGETKSNCPDDCKEVQIADVSQILSTSFFVKKDYSSQQWDKSVQLEQNATVYFMLVVANGSNFQADNVTASVNIPSEISYLGNLEIDGVAISGDIVSGIEIGSVQPMAKKTITFEGKTQIFEINDQQKATASISSGQISQSDSISIIFDNSISNTAGITSNTASEGIMGFLERWGLWIIAGAILVGLFMVIFKRLSGNV